MEEVFGKDILAGRHDSNIQNSYWNEMAITRDIVHGESHMQSDPSEIIEERKNNPKGVY
jgi:hypothetical protein